MQSNAQLMDKIKARADAVRKNMTAVCKEAGVAYSTYWRGVNNPDKITLETIGKLEDALTRLEVARATA